MFKKGMTKGEVVEMLKMLGYDYEVDDCGDFTVNDGGETALVLDFMCGDKLMDIYRGDWQ